MMRCKHLMVPVLLFLLLLFIVIDFFWEFSTALQVAILNLIAISIIQLSASGYKNDPRRDGYIIGAFTFLILNFGMLDNGVNGLIFATVLTGLMLCTYEVSWHWLWEENSTVKSNLLWLFSIAGILYLASLEGIKPLVSAVFIMGIILVGYAAFKRFF